MQYDEWVKQFLADVQKKIPDAKEQEEITKAGAEVLANAISDKAKKLHYSKAKDEHLADDIHVQDGDITGDHNGKTTVGFAKKGYIARFLNDGTKFRKGDHWYDTTVKEVEPKVYEAMAKKMKEIEGK
ncbi:HK97-gp10 family putative phage morphogenesis protein [Lactobacillus sp. ESL0225]|uniref:HK97-gp10 family putative phage morphogenesis protein n=1 Tax=Lactobacillus sp. ESL0225 TaxID=2069351 RepID=UPI000EFC0397|nr:HK97-gp10 family putative phage morphogenesis protein [Lactobacillus sp. ESL0225]RMC47715.1 HK97 gp10 family phage protein [Lactobacillus sp. ESL0225]